MVTLEPLSVRSPHGDCVTARVIHQEEDWDEIRPEWETLYNASPYASPPLAFDWVRTWWRVYGLTYGRGLQIVTAWRGSRLVGMLPLYQVRSGSLGVRRLRFLSTGEAEYEETCPEYLNALCLHGEEEVCLGVVRACIERLAWDQLELINLPAGSPLLRSGALPGRARTFVRGSCPIADLTGGFEKYLGRLSANGRQQARRLLREGEKAGATFEIVAADQAMAAFDDLVRLHQARWTAGGKPGVFAAPRFTAFHRELVREWLPRERAMLARLSVGGERVAVLYGFIVGSRFEFYQSGVRYEITGRLRSPGNLAHLLLMQAVLERGVTAYDFLSGTSAYKDRLATCENRLFDVHIWRPTLRAAACRSIRLGVRGTKRSLPFLFPPRR